MTSYLIDTSILSATAPDRPPAPTRFSEWVIANEHKLHISVITVAEIEQGIVSLRSAGGTRRADALQNWLDRAIHLLGRRVLPITTAVARMVGRLSAEAKSVGRHPGFPDIAIAATALDLEAVLLTRNLRHFEPLGVTALDPFAPDFQPP